MERTLVWGVCCWVFFQLAVGQPVVHIVPANDLSPNHGSLGINIPAGEYPRWTRCHADVNDNLCVVGNLTIRGQILQDHGDGGEFTQLITPTEIRSLKVDVEALKDFFDLQPTTNICLNVSCNKFRLCAGPLTPAGIGAVNCSSTNTTEMCFTGGETCYPDTGVVPTSGNETYTCGVDGECSYSGFPTGDEIDIVPPGEGARRRSIPSSQYIDQERRRSLRPGWYRRRAYDDAGTDYSDFVPRGFYVETRALDAVEFLSEVLCFTSQTLHWKFLGQTYIALVDEQRCKKQSTNSNEGGASSVESGSDAKGGLNSRSSSTKSTYTSVVVKVDKRTGGGAEHVEMWFSPVESSSNEEIRVSVDIYTARDVDTGHPGEFVAAWEMHSAVSMFMGYDYIKSDDTLATTRYRMGNGVITTKRPADVAASKLYASLAEKSNFATVVESLPAEVQAAIPPDMLAGPVPEMKASILRDLTGTSGRVTTTKLNGGMRGGGGPHDMPTEGSGVSFDSKNLTTWLGFNTEYVYTRRAEHEEDIENAESYTEFCFSRNTFDEVVYEYSVFDASTGSAFRFDGGFPITAVVNGTRLWGWADSWGVWLDGFYGADASVISNSESPYYNLEVKRDDWEWRGDNYNQNDATRTYSMRAAPGKLYKHGAENITLESVLNVHRFWVYDVNDWSAFWAASNQSSEIMYLDSNSGYSGVTVKGWYALVYDWTKGGDKVADMSTAAAVYLNAQFERFSMWSDTLQADANYVNGTTYLILRTFTQVTPASTDEFGAALNETLTLVCTFGCIKPYDDTGIPVSNFTGEWSAVEYPAPTEAPYYHSYNYTIDNDDMTLKEETTGYPIQIQPPTLGTFNPFTNKQWDYDGSQYISRWMGNLMTWADRDVALDPNNPWKLWDQTAYSTYSWQFGTQPWDQWFGLFDETKSEYVSFEGYSRLSYTDEGGKVYQLQYDGTRLHGLPWKGVDTDGDGQVDRYQPRFTLPEGSSLTGTRANGDPLSLVVKWNMGAQFPQSVNCATPGVPDIAVLPEPPEAISVGDTRPTNGDTERPKEFNGKPLLTLVVGGQLASRITSV